MHSHNLPKLTQQKAKILLVDDQPINIQALYQAFAGDYDVCMATSGQQAIAVCLQQMPDIILLDIEMPDMDGFEVCTRLKADPVTRDIPVIFVTAHRDEASETQGLDLGAVDFIYKPINTKIVRARVKTHITLKQQTDLLRRWVYIDGLTGVYNRRYFDEVLSTEWQRSIRNDTELSLILIDVDYFKRYNDNYSHQAGDDCLKRVAEAIRLCIKRPADLLARYGGEEFVCLLPETNREGANVFAEEVRKAVIELQFEHLASTVMPIVTLSLGVSSKPAGYKGTTADLLQKADEQLYRAKAEGRNRTCSGPL